MAKPTGQGLQQVVEIKFVIFGYPPHTIGVSNVHQFHVVLELQLALTGVVEGAVEAEDIRAQLRRCLRHVAHLPRTALVTQPTLVSLGAHYRWSYSIALVRQGRC